MTRLIEAHDLVRSFGKGDKKVFAVNGISLHVNAGELVVLMGPSGSGKTTLLAMLGRLLKPTSGSIRLLGEDITTLSSVSLARLRGESIGFIFQGFNLLSALSAWENVALAADFAFKRSVDGRGRAIELFEGMGGVHRIHHLPADLSAGEKQRVAFARALLNNPKIILADERLRHLADRILRIEDGRLMH